MRSVAPKSTARRGCLSGSRLEAETGKGSRKMGIHGIRTLILLRSQAVTLRHESVFGKGQGWLRRSYIFLSYRDREAASGQFLQSKALR
jgi:hypothetical protein